MACNPNLTEVIAVLDRSGSMGGDIENVIEGYNGFVEEQKRGSGECRFTLYIFDSEGGFGSASRANIDKLYENIDVHDVKPLSKDVYFARGGTPLNDAIGRAIDEAGARYSSIPEEQRPGKVIVFISTDGAENSSVEYPRRGNEALRKKIETQQNEFSWEFVFTAANVDAYELNQDFQIDVANVLRSDTGEAGTKALYGGLSAKLASYRSGEVASMNFTDDEKGEVEKFSNVPGLEPEPAKNPVLSSSSSEDSGQESTDESGS